MNDRPQVLRDIRILLISLLLQTNKKLREDCWKVKQDKKGERKREREREREKKRESKREKEREIRRGGGGNKYQQR